jgi:hypothetical protein
MPGARHHYQSGAGCTGTPFIECTFIHVHALFGQFEGLQQLSYVSLVQALKSRDKTIYCFVQERQKSVRTSSYFTYIQSRVIRFGEFSHNWPLFIWGRGVFFNCRTGQNFMLFFPSLDYVLDLTKMGLDYILGEFFTNSSGHPDTLALEMCGVPLTTITLSNVAFFLHLNN